MNLISTSKLSGLAIQYSSQNNKYKFSFIQPTHLDLHELINISNQFANSTISSFSNVFEHELTIDNNYIYYTWTSTDTDYRFIYFEEYSYKGLVSHKQHLALSRVKEIYTLVKPSLTGVLTLNTGLKVLIVTTQGAIIEVIPENLELV